jgi:hypothetical protein
MTTPKKAPAKKAAASTKKAAASVAPAKKAPAKKAPAVKKVITQEEPAPIPVIEEVQPEKITLKRRLLKLITGA